MDTVQGPDRMKDEQFTQWVEAHQLALLRFCYAYLHDQSMAEDAVQETFLKAYRSMDQFRGEASVKTWLSRIALNVCRDARKSSWFRHVDRRVSLDMLPEPAAEATPRDQAVTAEILNLPFKLRECVLLYYFQDMTTTEIAQTLHITQQAVSSRLMRARERLRRTLEGSGKNE